jgi:hypothetical protein
MLGHIGAVKVPAQIAFDFVVVEQRVVDVQEDCRVV